MIPSPPQTQYTFILLFFPFSSSLFSLLSSFFFFLLFFSLLFFLHKKKMDRLSRLFLSSDLSKLGAKEAPTSVAVSAHEKQTIGFIPLRLSPPIKIRTIRDVFDLFLNHEFSRLLMIVLWLVFCGFIETFMAQLSDMRYHAGPAISKVTLTTKKLIFF